MKIPTNLDQQMWAIAETNDPTKVAEFKKKNPTLAAELDKRLSMVDGLVGSKPIQKKVKPRFMPSQKVVAQPDVPRWAIATAVTLLIASLAFAGYGGYAYFQAKQTAENTTTYTYPEKSDPQILTQPDGVQPTNSDDIEDKLTENQPKHERPIPPPPFETPITVVSGRTMASEVIRDIATQAGIVIELAPGFEDMEVRVDFREVSAQNALNSLGNTVGFTAFAQTERSILIIPATNRNSPTQERELPGVAEPAPSNNGGLPHPDELTRIPPRQNE